MGFKEEINVLLKKIESRKRHGAKVSRARRESSSFCLKREIQKLECLMEYNGTPLIAKGKGERSGGIIFSL